MYKYLFSILAITFIPFVIKSQEIYFPPSNSNEWESVNPSELDWCDKKLQELYSFLENEETDAFMILKDGKIVVEEYFGSYTADSTHTWFSAGKSQTAVLVGLAQEKGLLNIHDKSSDYLGLGWTSLNLDQEDSITILNQLTMTSGLDDTNFFCTSPDCLSYHSPVNTRWRYHNGPYTLLRDVVENASGQNFNTFAHQNLGSKIGMKGLWVKIAFTNFYYSRARDMARFGILMQNNGDWKEEEIIADKTFLNSMINTSQELNPSYGYLWWLNGKDDYIPADSPDSVAGSISPDAPADVYSAAGGKGQFISISPSEGLIMIRQGWSSSEDKTALELHNEIWKRIVNLKCSSSYNAMENKLEVIIHPNPANDFIDIKVKDNSELNKIELYNSSGQLVPVRFYDSRKIEIGNLDQGIYLLKLYSENEVHIQKIVKS